MFVRKNCPRSHNCILKIFPFANSHCNSGFVSYKHSDLASTLQTDWHQFSSSLQSTSWTASVSLPVLICALGLIFLLLKCLLSYLDLQSSWIMLLLIFYCFDMLFYASHSLFPVLISTSLFKAAPFSFGSISHESVIFLQLTASCLSILSCLSFPC